MSHDETLRQTHWAATMDSSRTTREAWAWESRHGAAEWASPEQLVFWLRHGNIPPQTRVWKPGWRGWLPAQQVAELAVAFPRATAREQSAAQNARNPSERAAPPSSPTLTPHALELPLPNQLAGSATPGQASTADGDWPLLGTLVAVVVGVLSLGSSWAAFSLVTIAARQVEPAAQEDPSSAQPAAAGSGMAAPSPAEEPARGAASEALHTADGVQRSAEHEPAVLRVSDLPKPRARALPTSARAPAQPHARTRH